MEAIPAMPVSPAPVSEAAAPRDAKSREADSRRFGSTLKQEIAARSTAAREAPADSATASESAAEEKAQDTAVTDAAGLLDPSVAALLADPTTQPQPVAVAAAVQQTGQVGAEAGEASDRAAEVSATDMRPAGAQRAVPEHAAADRAVDGAARRGGERAAAERQGLDKANAEHGASERGLERSVVERAVAGERGVFERAVAGERGVFERAPIELRTMRDSDDRGFLAHDKSADAPVASLLSGFTVDRGATGVDAPLPVAAAAASLDSLSAAGLGAKWGAPVAGDAAAAPVVTARVDNPLGTPGWGDGFQQKVVWMVDRQLERAELHVNPPHLGPVDVMLNLTGDGAQIAFSSPHAAVREAIEASLHDLKNALDQRGLSLGQATVGSDSGAAREQFAEQAREAAARNGRSGNGAVVADSPTPARAAVVRRGLVDTFA